MVFPLNNTSNLLNQADIDREKKIVSRLNLNKLPFKITEKKFCSMYAKMFDGLRPLFRYRQGEYALKWCFSTEKRMRVFLLIFEANEFGNEIYKENISSKLPEYSYKTIAQIVDEGIDKGYFIKLAARAKKSTDTKITNIRPSEDLVIEFINWNIDLLFVSTELVKEFK